MSCSANQFHEEDGHLPRPLENGYGADRSTLSDEGRLFSKSGFDGALGGLRVRTVEDGPKRLQHSFRLDLDSRVLLSDELFEQSENLLGPLIRDEPHADLQFPASRHHGFHAGAGIAADQSMNLKGR